MLCMVLLPYSPKGKNFSLSRVEEPFSPSNKALIIIDFSWEPSAGALDIVGEKEIEKGSAFEINMFVLLWNFTTAVV